MIDLAVIAAGVMSLLVLIWLLVEVRRPWPDGKVGKLLRLLLLVGSLIALHRLLFPPLQPVSAQTLVVLTANTSLDQSPSSADPLPAEVRVALPEASLAPGTQIKVFPDLGSALRRYPAVQRLRILGAGLGPRDLSAAAGLAVDYVPPANASALVSLVAPTPSTPGARWQVSGRVNAASQAQLRLLDPHGAVVANGTPDAQGRFELTASTPVAGNFVYSLALIGADEAPIEALAVPVQVRVANAPRILLWSAAPNPEIKYLRRWAMDAGLTLHSTVALRPRLQLNLGSPQSALGDLEKSDLLIIDDRSWAEFSPVQRDAVIEAVGGGLGLLLRLTGEPDPAAQKQLADLGFAVSSVEQSRLVRLDDPQSDTKPTAGVQPPIALQRRTVAVSAPHSRPLLNDQAGEALGRWRVQGQGRIGLLWLSDSYRLQLGGQPDRYGSLWAGLLQTLSRAQGSAAPTANQDQHWVDELVSWCGLALPASVREPSGEETALVANADGCAAYWPGGAGWHQLQDGAGNRDFYVREADTAAGLRLQQQIARNLSLPIEPPGAEREPQLAPGPRWPWFLLWLALSGGLWWLERRVTARRTMA